MEVNWPICKPTRVHIRRCSTLQYIGQYYFVTFISRFVHFGRDLACFSATNELMTQLPCSASQTEINRFVLFSLFVLFCEVFRLPSNLCNWLCSKKLREYFSWEWETFGEWTPVKVLIIIVS